MSAECELFEKYRKEIADRKTNRIREKIALIESNLQKWMVGDWCGVQGVRYCMQYEIVFDTNEVEDFCKRVRENCESQGFKCRVSADGERLSIYSPRILAELNADGASFGRAAWPLYNLDENGYHRQLLTAAGEGSAVKVRTIDDIVAIQKELAAIQAALSDVQSKLAQQGEKIDLVHTNVEAIRSVITQAHQILKKMENKEIGDALDDVINMFMVGAEKIKTIGFFRPLFGNKRSSE